MHPGEVVAGVGEAVESAAGRYRPRHIVVSAASRGKQQALARCRGGRVECTETGLQRLAYIGRRARLRGAHGEAREPVIDSGFPENMEMVGARLEIALPHQRRSDGGAFELARAGQGVVLQYCSLVKVFRHPEDALEKSLRARRFILAIGCGELGIDRLDLAVEHDDGIRVNANV